MAGAKLNPLLQKVALVRDDDFYMGLDDIAFRTCVQEKAHHSLEIQVCHAEHTGCEMFPQRPALVEHLLELWDRRGLSHELPEYRFARRLVDMANDYLNGRPIDLSPYAPRRLTPEEADRFDKILYGRRSVRAFDMERDVPDEMIDRLIDAALWAPNGGTMQPCRFLVIREKNEPGLFRGSDIPGGPVHIVIAVDTRGSRVMAQLHRGTVPPDEQLLSHRNTLLNCGAAGQNIVLAAHALGLSGVWLTFAGGMTERIARRFDLPDYIHLMTFIDVGYGVQTPVPPPKSTVSEAVLARV